MEIKKGDRFFGKWEVVKLIGKGSFGSVYEIVRREYDREYRSAMKVMTLPDENEYKYMVDEGASADQIKSFYNKKVRLIASELDLMAKLKGNSNIVSYEDHDIIRHDDGVGFDIFIRMELLRPLTEYVNLRDGNLDVAEIVKIGIDICRALESCEKRGIIHRDIKPQNIFVSDDDNFKLGDFGVARQVESNSLNMTRVGTCRFIAPEVFNGNPYGPKADIYSLGLVLYYYLNNRRIPFSSDGYVSTFEEQEQLNMRRVKGEPLPAPANGSEKLKSVVLKACSFDPEKRFADAHEFRVELQRIYDIYSDGSAKTDIIPLKHRLKEDVEDWFDEEIPEITEPEQEFDEDGEVAEAETGNSDKNKMKIVGSIVLVLLVFCIAVALFIVFSSQKPESPNDESAGIVQDDKTSQVFDSSRKRSFVLDADGKTVVLGSLYGGKAKIYVESQEPELSSSNEVIHAKADKFYFSCATGMAEIAVPISVEQGQEIGFAANDYNGDGKIEYAVVFYSYNESGQEKELVVIDSKLNYNAYATEDVYNFVNANGETAYNEEDKLATFTLLNETVAFNGPYEGIKKYTVDYVDFSVDNEKLPLGVSFEIKLGNDAFRAECSASVENGSLKFTKAELIICGSDDEVTTEEQSKTVKQSTTKNIVIPVQRNNSAKPLYDSSGNIYGVEVSLSGTLTIQNLKGGNYNVLVNVGHSDMKDRDFTMNDKSYTCSVVDYKTYHYSFNVENNSSTEEISTGNDILDIYDKDGNYVESYDVRDFAIEKFGVSTDYFDNNTKDNVVSINKTNDKLVMTLKFGRSFSESYVNDGLYVCVSEGLYKTETGINSCEIDEYIL